MIFAISAKFAISVISAIEIRSLSQARRQGGGGVRRVPPYAKKGPPDRIVKDLK